MFFFFSKILGFLLSPILWVFFLLLYSFKTKIDTRASKARIASVLILYICCNSFVVDECFRQWEPVTPDYDLMDTKYDGAIILGGIGSVDQRLQKLNFGWGADRLMQVFPLYYKGRVKKIIFTGGSGSIEFPQNKEGFYVKKYLRSIHIPDSAMIIENESKNTYENAVFTKKILDSLKINGNFLLVTSGYHMRRSMAVFKKAGYKNLTPYVTNRVSGIRRYSFDHLFIPNQDALFTLQILIHEWLGFIVYKIKGYA